MRLDKESGSWFPNDFEYGENFRHGIGCIIEPDVTIGSNVQLGHRVMLKSGTIIKDDVVLADDCRTTGLCIIGNNATARTGTTISKGVIVNDWAFLGAGIMTSHTKNVPHGRPKMEHKQLITQLGYGCIIGSGSNLKAGVQIAPGVIVGYGSNVLCDFTDFWGICRGNPAKLVDYVQIASPWRIDIPAGYVPYQFTKGMLEKYLPGALNV